MDERPKWSITWLLRIQRVGRDRREISAAGDSQPSAWQKLFPWAVVLLLLLEIAVLVWVGVLPR